MRTLTRVALTGAAAVTLSLTASPALAEPECTYVDGTTRCEEVTVESKEQKNKTRTTTQYESTSSFAGEVFASQSYTTRETVSKDGDTKSRTEGTFTDPNRTCEQSYSSKTKNGETKNGKSNISCTP